MRTLITLLFFALSALPSLAQANTQYTIWSDPAERAFSVSLPANWQISGGTVRNTRIDVHYVVRAQAPDGGAQLFIDDPRILMREVPGRATMMMRARAGQVISAGDGTKLLVEPYRDGAQMAEQYARQSLCPNASSVHGGSIPAQTQALNQEFGPIARAENKTIHVDAGEISFKCGDRNGYVYAITVQAFQPGGAISIWAVYRIAGYLATPADTSAAAAAVNQALGTFQMNQQWLQAYARESGDITGNVIRESNAITQTTIAREKAMTDANIANAENMRKNSDANFNAINRTNAAITGSNSSGSGGNGNGHDYNAQLGTKRVCDDLDRCQQVDAGVTNWWSDCSGQFHPGSESGGAPSPSESACWSKGH